MRITNTMMMNQTLRNVSKSKSNLSELEYQMSTEKKIARPSDDPIVAIRALSLRSSLTEIDQYLNKNIPDAQSWLDITESSLDNMDGILTDIYQYCNQGASDQFTLEDRSAIIEVLNQYKEAIYSEANTSYAGRYCFTGYKTDEAFTFLTSEDANKNYSITQTFSGEDLTKISVMKNSVDVGTVTTIDAADTPESESVYNLRLAYEGCNGTAGTYSDVVVDGTSYSVVSVTQEEFEVHVANGDLSDPAATDVYYVYDTGELAIPDSLYATFKDAEDISFTFEKDGFEDTDFRPEMYFDCVDITDPTDPITYTMGTETQAISYSINFSQTIQVNTLGNESLSYKIGRDIDELCNALAKVGEVEDKIVELNEMYDSSIYTDAEKEQITTMIEAAEKELEYETDNMENLFSSELTRVLDYQQTVDLQLADLGARSTRLDLTKSRLTEQNTTFEDLKSKNEDVELEDTVIKYSAAQTLYQAALTAASNTVKESLLDYI